MTDILAAIDAAIEAPQRPTAHCWLCGAVVAELDSTLCAADCRAGTYYDATYTIGEYGGLGMLVRRNTERRDGAVAREGQEGYRMNEQRTQRRAPYIGGGLDGQSMEIDGHYHVNPKMLIYRPTEGDLPLTVEDTREYYAQMYVSNNSGNRWMVYVLCGTDVISEQFETDSLRALINCGEVEP